MLIPVICLCIDWGTPTVTTCMDYTKVHPQSYQIMEKITGHGGRIALQGSRAPHEGVRSPHLRVGGNSQRWVPTPGRGPPPGHPKGHYPMPTERRGWYPGAGAPPDERPRHRHAERHRQSGWWSPISSGSPRPHPKNTTRCAPTENNFQLRRDYTTTSTV